MSRTLDQTVPKGENGRLVEKFRLTSCKASHCDWWGEDAPPQLDKEVALLQLRLSNDKLTEICAQEML
jgi:hypothetical protein